MPKPIQEQFGEAVIGAVEDFARRDLKSVNDLELNEFNHVADPALRRAIAETFYGARWIYKLGLALLVQNEEQMAHVRSQVLDYGAVCEGLLTDCIHHGLDLGVFAGQKHRHTDVTHLNGAINWQTVNNKANRLRKLPFYWHIEVAEEEHIVTLALAKRLHGMRRERNTVHVAERTYRAYVGTSKFLFQTVCEVIAATKAWRQAHP